MDSFNFQKHWGDLTKVFSILKANQDKSFVKRILTPDAYPRLKVGQDQYATHKMAWMEVDGKYHVFPTVLFDGEKLKQYKPEKAYEYANKTGNYISFDNPKEADWFSKNYKLVWGID